MPKSSSGKTAPTAKGPASAPPPDAPPTHPAAPRGRPTAKRRPVVKSRPAAKSRPAVRAPVRRQAPAPSQDEPFARIVVDVPESTHRQLKATAAMEGKSIRDFILEMLAENGIL